jgi:HSP20 family protein
LRTLKTSQKLHFVGIVFNFYPHASFKIILFWIKKCQLCSAIFSGYTSSVVVKSYEYREAKMVLRDQGIGNIIDNLSSSVGDAIKMAERQISSFTGRRPFVADVIEEGDAYLVQVDLPGVEKENIAVSLEGGKLIITVTDPEEEEVEKDYLLQERGAMVGSRSFDFSALSATDDPSAELKDGVLKIRLVKSSSTQVKKITIA